MQRADSAPVALRVRGLRPSAAACYTAARAQAGADEDEVGG
jgi:hypothetical protein